MSDLKVLSDSDLKKKVGILVGTRPSLIMLSPIIKSLEASDIDSFTVHSGQHYSDNMDKVFFDDLGLSAPDHHLEDIKEYSLHGEQTAEMIRGIEQILIEEAPQIFLVAGDTNTNLAGALAAKKLGIDVGHIEAGERSENWEKPEEYNRVMIDDISDYLFVTNERGKENLENERVHGEVFITGNPISDALANNIELAREKSDILSALDVDERGYLLATVHREENVDNYDSLTGIIDGLIEVDTAYHEDIVFVAHPRTLDRLETFDLEDRLSESNLQVEEALGYYDFVNLLSNAEICITDSLGVQQESCILQVPCITLSDKTEWIETVEIGANRLSGNDPASICASVKQMYGRERDWENPFGKGDTAETIRDIVARKLDRKDTER